MGASGVLPSSSEPGPRATVGGGSGVTPPLAPAPAPNPTTAVEVWAAVGVWTGALATSTAVGVALWISHRDWRRADAKGRDRAKAQARLVEIGLPTRRTLVMAYNHSDSPVFKVLPEFLVEYDDPDLIGHFTDTEPFRVLAAGADRACTVTVRHRNGDLIEPRAPVASPVRLHLAVTFTDAAGLRWRRVGQDEPERIEAESVTGEQPPVRPAPGFPSSWCPRRRTG